MRLVDSIYWPAVQMVMWGFMTQYLLPQASFVAQAAGVLLSGLLLWEVLVRGNLSLSIAFLEEMWSRNLGHLFVSPDPLVGDWLTGIIIASLILRTLLGMIPVSLLAWAFFGYNDLHARPAAGGLLRDPADVLLVDRSRHERAWSCGSARAPRPSHGRPSSC
jgi:ABC-2 type transport system permease protein